jgi:hypothetical protein
MQNSIYLKPQLISNCDTDSSLAAVKCENLRLMANGDGANTLTVVGNPDKIISGDYTPLAAANSTLFLKNGRTLYHIPVAGGELTELCTLDSDIRRAFPANGYLIIVTDAGTYRAYYDKATATWQAPLLQGDYRPVSLRAIDTLVLQQTVGERTLSKVYNNDLTPLVTDKNAIKSDLNAAYTALAKSAREQEVFLQPALCRYRLRDDQGRILFTSPTVLLSATSGQQLTSAIAVGSSDRQTINAYNLDVATWRMQLDIADGTTPADDRVASLEVLMSPQLHPYSETELPLIMFMRRDTSSNFMRIFLPGEALSTAAVAKLASRMDSMERVVATINRPFADSAQTSISITVSNFETLSNELSTIKKTLTADVTRVDNLTARLLPPHNFTAQVASTASGVTLWGNITANRYDGYPLNIFAANTASKPWRATVKVQFADGSETAVWQGQFSSACPTAINPILSYPSADAVKMTISLSANGQSPLLQTFDLTADETGTCARYIDSGLKPFNLSASTEPFSIPDANAIPLDLPDVIVATDAAQPQLTKVVKQLDCGTVNAITPARVGQNAWDFGRSRFYVMTEQGISSVAINAAQSALSVNLIDSRGVGDNDAVTVADDQIIVAASNGDLLALRSSRISTIRADAGYKHLAWVSSRRELWGVDADGAVDVVCFDYDYGRYQRTGLTIKHFLGHSGGAVAQTDSGVVNIYKETATMLQPVNWGVSISPKRRDQFVPGILRLDMAALKFLGSVTLSRVGLTSTPTAPDLSASINGELRSPLILKPLARPMRSFRLNINANVTTDFRFAGCLHYFC